MCLTLSVCVRMCVQHRATATGPPPLWLNKTTTTVRTPLRALCRLGWCGCMGKGRKNHKSQHRGSLKRDLGLKENPSNQAGGTTSGASAGIAGRIAPVRRGLGPGDLNGGAPPAAAARIPCPPPPKRPHDFALTPELESPKVPKTEIWF